MEEKDKILINSVIDKYNKYLKTNKSMYTNFFNIRELNIVTKALDKMHIKYNIYKYKDYLEKTIIYFGEYEDFITIYKFKINDITHKDVLGTLFSIGYNPSIIGDIFINDDICYITNLTRLNSFLETNLVLIKDNYINLEKTNEIVLSDNRFITLNIVIPSYRLDAIVSKLAHTSRSKTNDLIKDKMILINYEEVTSNKLVNIGDIISIRKVGKFIIDKELSKSKKDNYFIEVRKYN